MTTTEDAQKGPVWKRLLDSILMLLGLKQDVLEALLGKRTAVEANIREMKDELAKLSKRCKDADADQELADKAFFDAPDDDVTAEHAVNDAARIKEECDNDFRMAATDLSMEESMLRALDVEIRRTKAGKKRGMRVSPAELREITDRVYTRARLDHQEKHDAVRDQREHEGVLTDSTKAVTEHGNAHVDKLKEMKIKMQRERAENVSGSEPAPRAANPEPEQKRDAQDA